MPTREANNMDLLNSDNPKLFLNPNLVNIGGCSFRTYDCSTLETQEKNPRKNLAPYVEYDDNMLSCTELDDQIEVKYTKSGQIMAEFHTAAAYFAMIVGMKGLTKRSIEQGTNTHIKVPKPGQTGNIIITGESERQVASAHSRIQMIIFKARDKQMMTHFLSIPCISNSIDDNFGKFKAAILNGPPLRGVDETIFQKADKLHLTLVALVLMDEIEEQVANETLIECQQEIKSLFESAGNISLVLQGLEIMNDDSSEVDVLYGKVSINPPKYNSTFQKMADQVLEKYTKKGFLRKQYDSVKLHVTLLNSLFRKNKQSSDKPPARKIRESFDASHILDKYKHFNFGETDLNMGSMHGVTRVLIFCSMTIILPSILIIIPLYLKHQVFADKRYSLFESDVVAISEGMSSIFCQSHTLRMNITFNAFQVKDSPHISRSKRKHIRLKKSMSLPDDTLEYWGFYLLKGAMVSLKVCSRYDGSRLLVVRGEKILQTCGLLQHNDKKIGTHMDQDYKQVKVTFETKQEIYDDHNAPQITNLADTHYNNTKTHNNRFINVKTSTIQIPTDDKELIQNTTPFNEIVMNDTAYHHLRHEHKKHKRKKQLNDLKQTLESDDDNMKGVETDADSKLVRHPRDIGQKLDGRIEHGGNAINYSFVNSAESVSSFEMGLLTCYDGSILLTQEFDPSHLCTDINYLDNGDHMETIHDVASDGYYYYIFYSDNDLISNDIHAVFDIHKPTLQFGNYTKNKACINETECTFPVVFWSDETVIVEVPTKDGIEVHEDDGAFLVSVCHPRMGVYIIFPITVLFIILGCAFL